MRLAAVFLVLILICPELAGAQADVEVPDILNVSPVEYQPPYIPFPSFPVPPLDESLNKIGLAQQISREKGLQARMMWIDATANLNRFNTEEKIEAMVKRIKAGGFNMLVFETKPIVGYTLHPSKYAPKLTEWRKANELRTLPVDFDPLKFFAKYCKQYGLQLIVNFNTFAEGHRDFRMGPGYEHPDWQTTLYEPTPSVRANYEGCRTFSMVHRPNVLAFDGTKIAVFTDMSKISNLPGDAMLTFINATGVIVANASASDLEPSSNLFQPGGSVLIGFGDAAAYMRETFVPGQTLVIENQPQYVLIQERPEQQIPLMTNPHSHAVRQRLIDMIMEVVRGYDIDGVIFDDRFRYANINADFSQETRRDFELWLGRKLNWPDDVFRYELSWPNLGRRVVPGPEFENWLVWRAATLRNWLARTVAAVKSAKPAVTVSVYAGSWYGEYPKYGSNWAADDFEAGFRFLTPQYQQTGYAGLLDWITTGCYYTIATANEAIQLGTNPGATVEAAGQLSTRAVNNKTWAYAGIMLTDFKGDLEALKRCLQAAAASTQGIMVFDWSHDIDTYWPVLSEAFAKPATSPHAVPGLTGMMRQQHLKNKEAGLDDPAVIIQTGTPGVGF